ncbi:MAG: hypothetical protein K8S99_12260 [Planctomycetes bacterium]|nr:hypothetical protein [Planctomycetota bacterium]
MEHLKTESTPYLHGFIECLEDRAGIDPDLRDAINKVADALRTETASFVLALSRSLADRQQPTTAAKPVLRLVSDDDTPA